MTKKDIIDAYVKIRTIDTTIPDEVLDFMKDAALEALEFGVEKPKPSRLEIAARTMQGIVTGGESFIKSELAASKALEYADELIRQESETSQNQTPAISEEKIIYWAKQLEGKILSLHQLVENAKWLLRQSNTKI